jgi:ADP-heptose:LPS heptosyltransferase
MKKILIINLRRLGDVYSTGHLINSLSQSSKTEITMLVFSESTKAAQNLTNVKKVYSIDREELITISNNKLFNDSLALEKLFTTLSPLKSENWDIIINFSNDLVSAYLTSYLKNSSKKLVGVRFNEKRAIESTSTWEVIFNDVLTSMKNSPLHFVDCYHKMLNISIASTGEKLILNESHNDVASSSISNIKSGESNNLNAKVIAIQGLTSNNSKNISPSTLIKYINLIKNAESMIPILLIAPTSEEREFANLINEQVGESLIVVEADLSAVASIIKNVDLVVTPDTVIKHIADLCGAGILEISKGDSPFLKQGAHTEGSLTLSDSVNTRNFTNNSSEVSNISAEDIYASTIYYFSNTKNMKPRLTDGVTLYKTFHDSIGATFMPLAGTIDFNCEISRMMSRQFISALFDNYESIELYEEIMKFGKPAVSEWCNQEKTIITNTMKDLLGTLRSLLQSVERKRNSRDFIVNLSKLMNHCEETSVSQIASIIFKTKIESITARSFEENAKEVEVLLYELKSFLQKDLQCIKALEDRIYQQKKEEMFQRPTLSF